ncbi:MAG: DUF1802 family protein [Verrucomicrobiales bacterium]|nr:DUF1802 family protein [Verrucomicrobiales bacterium]
MSIAFKEWSLVCDALRRGATSLILRKGGIAEGRAGFQWKHEAFYLLPTHFHEQVGQIRGATELPAHDPEQHRIDLFARVEFHAVVTDWGQVAALLPHHVWTEEVAKERFGYSGQQGLSVAFLRVFSMAQPLTFPDAPAYGGCRSWVTIPDAPAEPVLQPVLDEAGHAARREVVRSILGPAGGHS